MKENGARHLLCMMTPFFSIDNFVSVSGRKTRDVEDPIIEPLVDTASVRYKSIIRVRQKVEINDIVIIKDQLYVLQRVELSFLRMSLNGISKMGMLD